LGSESPSKESPKLPVRKPTYLKSLRLNSEKLKKLPLKPGENTIIFSVGGDKIACSSKIYLWPSNIKIVISDIDGTITKSDALGHFFAMLGKDWTHSGVASLYNAINRNGYKFLYLTSRSIGQSTSTQKYIRSIEQDKYKLPDGPIIMSPDRLLAALKREVILGNPEEFKIAALKDIQRLFSPNGDDLTKSPFYAGFGNRITDAQSYHAVGVPPSRIFTINSHGSVWVEQLVLVAGSSSTYLAMTDIVDLYFPPVKSAPLAEDENFSELAFWKPQRFSLEQLIPAIGQPTSAFALGDDIILFENNLEQNQDESQLEEEEDEEEAGAPFPYI
jgi:phosphatidate phosphatase LPIN